jgi:hypothetical protein
MNITNKKYRLLTTTGYNCVWTSSIEDYGSKPTSWEYLVPDSIYDSLYIELSKVH